MLVLAERIDAVTEIGKVEQELKDASARVHRAQVEHGLATAERDRLIFEHEGTIRRRRMAELTDLAPSRIQQIIERMRGEG